MTQNSGKARVWYHFDTTALPGPGGPGYPRRSLIYVLISNAPVFSNRIAPTVCSAVAEVAEKGQLFGVATVERMNIATTEEQAGAAGER